MDPKCQDEDTKAIRALSLKIFNDKRVSNVMLTIGDGVMLVRKND